MAGVVQRLERRFVVPDTGVQLPSLAPRQSQIYFWLFLFVERHNFHVLLLHLIT
jgi:hypothetical protein